MAKVVCQAGPDAGHEYVLAKEKSVFGRRSSCDVQIMDSMASREHFIIRRDERLYTLIDLESRNGTKLNDRKVVERQLEFGDRIRVGEVEYLFVKEEGDVEIKDLLTKKYQIIEKIGEGGMGIVYKAVQRSMDRTVALKILASKYASRPRFVQRFIDEARAAGRLNHPNIIQVHDVDTENGINYFSMEYIDGATCMQLLRGRGPFSSAEALEIVRLTAKALQYAHENRIIHHDVKPDNIMVGSNNIVKLADLGISKTFEEAETEGRPKKVVGTPHYMAPEAALGKKIDHRIDIYSLGASLYHMLTGVTPFSGSSATEVLKAHIKKDPRPLHEITIDIDPRICALVDKMMAKEPDHRYQSAGEAAEAIQNVQRELELRPELTGSGGDTMLLKRFATGERSSTPSGSNPVGKPTSATTSRGSRLFGSRQREAPMPSFLRWGLIALVAIIVLLVLVQVVGGAIRRHLASEDAPGVGSGSEIAGDSGPGDRPQQSGGEGGGQDAQQTGARKRQQLSSLRRLRERLAGATAAVLPELGGELDILDAEAMDDEVRQEVTALRALLAERLQARQVEQDQERFRQVRAEVDELVLANDHVTALQRLAAFKVNRSGMLLQSIEELEAKVREDQARFADSLQRRFETHSARGDADGLRALRDELPESMLRHDIAKKIDKRLEELDLQAAEARQAVVLQVRESLAAWDLQRVHRSYAEHAPRMGASAAGKELQSLEDHAKKLEEMIARMDEALKQMAKKPRYDGQLRGFIEPDLIGANLDGLQVRPSGSGTATMPWRSLKPAELRTCVQMALGATMAEYAATLDAVIAFGGHEN